MALESILGRKGKEEITQIPIMPEFPGKLVGEGLVEVRPNEPPEVYTPQSQSAVQTPQDQKVPSQSIPFAGEDELTALVKNSTKDTNSTYAWWVKAWERVKEMAKRAGKKILWSQPKTNQPV